jgi:putative ABC transport system permease protein
VTRLLPAALSRHLLPAGVPLAWRQLTSRRLRFAAAVAGIAFASVMMLMQLGFRDALFDSVCLLHKSFDGELFLISHQYDSVGDARSFPRRRLNQALAVEGVERATPVYFGMAAWKNPATLHDRTIFIIGCSGAEPPMRLPGLAEGIEALRREDMVLFDSASRPEFGPITGRLGRNEPVATELAGRRVGVGGLFTLGTSFAADGNVLLGETAFHRLFPDRSPGVVSLGVLRVKAGSDPLKVQDELKTRLSDDVLVLTRAQLMKREVTYWAERTPIGFVISAGLIVGFIVGAVIVYQILYTDLTDHLKEYAVLKATGCSDLFLHGVVVQQAAVLAVAGFVPAAVMSWGIFALTRHATSLPAYLDVTKSVIVLSLTLGMCLVAGVLALRVLRQADPAEVF